MKQILFSLFMSIGPLIFSQCTQDSIAVKQLSSIVYALADDSMKGRSSGSVEEQKAFNFISSEFKLMTGEKLKTHAFSFSMDSLDFHSKNAYYFVNNHAKTTIVLSAHYDHIGLGGKLSKSFTSSEIHNGADDNASGVALLLSLSNDLIRFKSQNVNYLIVFYSGHEVGLFGSQAFYNYTLKRKKFRKLTMVINFDMVGRLDPTSKKIKCMCSQELEPYLLSLQDIQTSIKLNITEEEKLHFLDTKWYTEAGIPCINFTTGMHNDYHKTSDDANYVNYEGLNDLRKFMIDLLSKGKFELL